MAQASPSRSFTILSQNHPRRPYQSRVCLATRQAQINTLALNHAHTKNSSQAPWSHYPLRPYLPWLGGFDRLHLGILQQHRVRRFYHHLRLSDHDRLRAHVLLTRSLL